MAVSAKITVANSDADQARRLFIDAGFNVFSEEPRNENGTCFTFYGVDSADEKWRLVTAIPKSMDLFQAVVGKTSAESVEQ